MDTKQMPSVGSGVSKLEGCDSAFEYIGDPKRLMQSQGVLFKTFETAGQYL